MSTGEQSGKPVLEKLETCNTEPTLNSLRKEKKEEAVYQVNHGARLALGTDGPAEDGESSNGVRASSGMDIVDVSMGTEDGLGDVLPTQHTDALGLKHRALQQVEVLGSSNQYVHVRITNNDLQVWEMILVYGSPNIVQRRSLWRDILHLSTSITIPWCLGGDLNVTLGNDERVSRGTPRGPDREFCKFLEDVALNDLGFIGPPFTWKRTGVESRLDRVLGSTTWQETFPNAVVKHLNWYKSDHRPLLL
ncbi:hypothetical protein K1719_017246 [Acacia pycnantha]|nr:hypothetical protein K1719_017246 [Acacia pycnantha]